ncbi:unnamed protein product [Kluyveromyces dobzhanskii CBS 2104]|uniref:WGS project CCBQ000000000 data, contig 00041 n=1 Tax=Kluyveromyces dobzhanskii CBS 2104 TaxID=1427455 RepID=A0A0A8L2B5_9SACH|nr:unnamed protein product [Kluyveromyces dobzhanskii CBS 2104]
MVDCLYHETDIHSFFNSVLLQSPDAASTEASLVSPSGSLSSGFEDYLSKLAKDPDLKLKTDATDDSGEVDTKTDASSVSLFNNDECRFHEGRNETLADSPLCHPYHKLSKIGNFDSVNPCLDPKILSSKEKNGTKSTGFNTSHWKSELVSFDNSSQIACFDSAKFLIEPLRPLKVSRFPNREMLGVSAALVETSKQRHTAKRASRITKIARPLRKHVRFEYRPTSDEKFNVIFRGGFIRQNIIKSYFPSIEEDESVIPSNWKPVTVQLEDEEFYEKMLNSIKSQIQPACSHVRTYWKMTKRRENSKFIITITEEGLQSEPTFDEDNYYFNVISKVIESGSFGPIERGARNKDMIQKAIDRDDRAGNFRWCHFITSSEMKGIFDFFLQNYDYCANDNTVFDKLKANAKPDPFKHHESRVRSHMLGYISGKSCKLTPAKLTGKPKLFSEQMYRLIMSFDDYKRPYNTAKDISVMEVKYMVENLSDLLEKYYWVDPSTVPDEGYPMRLH